MVGHGHKRYGTIFGQILTNQRHYSVPRPLSLWAPNDLSSRCALKPKSLSSSVELEFDLEDDLEIKNEGDFRDQHHELDLRTKFGRNLNVPSLDL